MTTPTEVCYHGPCDACGTTHGGWEPCPPETVEDALAQVQMWDDAEHRAAEHRERVRAKLRTLREASGLSLRTVAKRAGLSPAALSFAETSPAYLSVEAVRRVLEVLRAAPAGEGGR